MHRFKEIYDKLSVVEKMEEKKNEMSYYDYMSALLSIYLDLNLDLQQRIKNFVPLRSKIKKRKETLCLNVFYLLGISKIYSLILFLT